MTLQPDGLLGPYRIQSRIGAGGMGEVYLAKDTRLGRTVALKVLPSNLADNEQMRQRLAREAQTISSLSHPHICTLYDIGSQDEKVFLVMEYIEGETLAAILEKRRLPLEEVLRYAIQIADALDKAHRKGIIHRDLKPGNVMITKSGVKLLDFGLAKSCQTDFSSTLSTISHLPTGEHLTAEGTILGTLPYMAPEQLEGKEADSRTDIFALGALLYEMLTGKKAFSASSQASLIAAILTAEVPPVSAMEPTASSQLDHVVARCLAKNREERWQAASDVMHELKWTADHLSKTPLSSQLVTPVRTRRPIAAIISALIVLGIHFVCCICLIFQAQHL